VILLKISMRRKDQSDRHSDTWGRLSRRRDRRRHRRPYWCIAHTADRLESITLPQRKPSHTRSVGGQVGMW